MKRSLLLLFAILFLYACTKTEIIPNRPPNAFTVTQTLKPDGKTIVLNWTRAKDPDGDAVSYAIVLKDTIAKNISDTTFTITGLDFNYNQAAKIIALDPKGLKTEATFTATTKTVVYASIPDPAFEKYLVEQKIDKDGIVNGKMNAENAKGITYLNILNKNIKSLVGIEFFVDLRELICYLNQLTVLDVSKNLALKSLECSSNQLVALDVSKNIALQSLVCFSNQLTELDVSNSIALQYLSCHSNKLTALDISKNLALKDLLCYSNKLTTLDVSKNLDLKDLLCYSNKLTTLDVSKNTNLESLVCGSNQLTTLDISKDTNLIRLDCSSNQLTALDVSINTVLRILECGKNRLTELYVSKNLALNYLECSSNQLIALDVSKNTVLQTLQCDKNQLKTICVADIKAIANKNWRKDAGASYAVCK